jgi:hypothetical protein
MMRLPAQVLPIDEHEKAKLLPIRSPRLRLRLVVHKAKVSKGNKKKKRNAENPVSEVQHVAGSSKNSNKRKKAAADNDVENLQRPASVFTCCLA